MNDQEFAEWSAKAAEWGVQYRASLDGLPVRARTAPGDIGRQIPPSPPAQGESMEAIFSDFETIIMPGMTHWQHPRFFAYFPANAAPVSVVAEYLVSAVAAQCMLWQTSPAATELETRVLDWLRQAIGLPDGFAGVIQDSASSATLAAVLVMRERATGWAGNRTGLSPHAPIRVYASGQTHTSVDRAIWVSGIGADNLVRIPVAGQRYAMDTEALERAIVADKAKGFLPAGIIACTGGTSIGACDDIGAVVRVARRHGLYVHVDAAWAGSAMICEEFRTLWTGVEGADSIVFNPHKWLGAQFDCSAHFIRDPADLVRTLAIQPEYLKTHGKDGIINYSEWSVPLGRRFRALKLWFLLRYYGLDGLKAIIRNHVAWAQGLAGRLRTTEGFEIVTEPVLSLFSFVHTGTGDQDAHNIALVNAINEDGRIYLTQTRVDGRIAIRFQAGSFTMQAADIDIAHAAITDIAARLTD